MSTEIIKVDAEEQRIIDDKLAREQAVLTGNDKQKASAFRAELSELIDKYNNFKSKHYIRVYAEFERMSSDIMNEL